MSVARKKRKKISDAGNGLARPYALTEPYPAGPVPQPKIVLYCRYPHNALPGEARSFVWTFNADYSARKFVDAMVGEDKYRWLRADQILTTRGILIETRDPQQEGGRRNSDLERVIEHEYSEAEAAWQIGVPDSLYLAHFLRPFDKNPILKAKQPERKVRAAPPRASREGLVTVGQICAELGVDARDARAALRRQKIEQPEAGWAWPKAEAVKIKAVITRACR